jgi:hypothetical protein
MTPTAMNALAKHLIVAALVCCVERTKTAMGVAALTDLETEITRLRTNLNTDPESVTAAEIAAAETMLNNLEFTEMTSISDLFSEAGQTT